ncbi:MAG TPA: hypothetical protein VFP84_38225 [Kofleriaceae bacterium]|nr:hypothetical protein [Kofleriaceae bacterium]
MPATNVQIAVLIADEDDIDAAIDGAIATMTDEAIFSVLSSPQDVPVTLIPTLSSAIEAAIERAIDAAIDDAIEAVHYEPATKGVFPTSYSDQAWAHA